MLVFKLIVCLLIIHECYSYSRLRSCSDCIALHECPDAELHPIEEMTGKLKKALCGRTTVNGNETIMICCSDFAIHTFIDTIDLSRRINIVDEDMTNDINKSDYHMNNIDEHANSIDNHANINLLPEICGKMFVDRIIGGNETDIYEFPWMALIYHKDNYGQVILDCGGSIISSRYILTAAHCVYEKTIVGVRVGDFNIQKPRYCQGVYPSYRCELPLQELRVQKTINHEEYCKYPNPINDIALLRVTEIDFSKRNVKPICLPVWKEIRDVNLSGKSATVAGWGLMSTRESAEILQKVIIPILPENECVNFFGRDSNQNESLKKTFCAGENGKDSCKGDSGGPLMIFDNYNDNFRMFQYGIVSYGSTHCGNEVPGVYTDVTKYMQWILDNIEE